MAVVRTVAVVGLMLAFTGCIHVALITLRPQCDPAAAAVNACMARTGCTDEPTCLASCADEFKAFEACEQTAAARRDAAHCVSDADCSGNTICLEGVCRSRPQQSPAP